MDAMAMTEARDDDVATAASGESRHEPRRRCIVTREIRPRRELLRLVIDPDGAVVPDIDGKLPGRGLWVTPSRAVVAEALKRGHIAKAAKRAVTAPADLADRIEAGIARRCLDLLGLARRAGQATAGFEKVRSWLAEGKAGLLVQAADASADGKRKLQALGHGAVPVIEALTAAELAAALGRETVVHVAVARGRLATRLADEARRLMSMRDGRADGAGAGGRQETIGTRND
jgi:predicted RNA-binding protein YlxR (DUF448 family)